uniref:Flavodoxin-like domain-containing protein n=1 Tax=Caenorhabditis japonica TaxID=281687 RepID=A0A8R1DP72_CAEJA
MNFQVPPLRPEGMGRDSKEPRSWMEDYLEGKDEILLYITAALGVLMPAFVYLLYHKCHAYYERYAKKKEEKRLAEELAQSEAVVIVLGKEDGMAAPWAKVIHDKLCDEMVRKPMLWWSDSLDIKELMAFQGFCVFIAETTAGGTPTPSTEWILEWLEDLAADSKLKKKANFDKIRFSIVGFGSSDDGNAGFNKVARTLLKRLKIVGSKQITEVELFNTADTDKKIMERFVEFSFELLLQMDKHLPGMGGQTDESDGFESSSQSSGSASDDDDDEEEEEEDGNRKHKKMK